MPIYEYRCHECAQIFEEWQKDFVDRQIPCPVCGSASERLISNTAFHLKGSGWYVTDYSKNKSSCGGNGNGDGNGSSGDKTASEPVKSDAPASPCASACATGSCPSSGGCSS